MKLLKSLIAISVAMIIGFNGTMALAKDKEYEFSFKGYVSKKITEQDDYAMLKASEYALKKGYEYFTIDNIRRYEKGSSRSSFRIGARKSIRKRLYTELKIHCYDDASTIEDAYKASDVKQEIDQKYGG